MKQVFRLQEAHRGKLLDSVNGYDIICCEECGFVHIMPIPSEEELKRIYKDEYYTEEKPLYIERLEEDIEWWNTVYDDRYEILETLLPDDCRSILDVGCGPGSFLKRGKERGWKVCGIEPSKVAAEYARGLGIDVIEGFFTKELKEKLCSFHVVHLSEVLEHLPDPEEFLRNVNDVVENGGLICCVVPNDYSPVQKILRERLGYKPYWLAPPHHINYFSFSTLEALLERTGFRVVHRTAMFPMDFFLLMGEDYVGDDATGRRCHGMRKRLDLLLAGSELSDFRKALYSLMAQYDVGREIILYARKKEQ